MMNMAGTSMDLEKSLAEEFARLFSDCTFTNSIGHSAAIKSFVHSLPVKKGDDELKSDDDLPEPYIISEVIGGKQASESEPHIVTVYVVACTCDDNTARQGHQDILLIIQRIIERFSKDPLLAQRFVSKFPIEWAIVDEDTYPYYYGGLIMQFEVPAIEKEDELA